MRVGEGAAVAGPGQSARLLARAARDGHRPPLSILRSRSERGAAQEAYEAFVADLRGVAAALAG